MDANSAAITHSHSTNNVTALTDWSVTRNSVTPERNWSGQEVEAEVIVPSESAIDSTILDEIVETIRTYIFISKSDATKMVLWVAHANVFRSFKATPRLIITAGTRGCGKTVTLNILKAMVNNSITDGDSTPASFYTLSQDGDKAFFLDEVDSWIKGEGRGDLMNSLKSGFNQGGSATRVEMVGSKRRVMGFMTHSAVALAEIGLDSKLDPAVVERSHIIYLRKALRGDLSVRFDDRKHLRVFPELGRKLVRWCTDNKAVIEAYDYQGHSPMPEHLINRAADCWEPFFTIASVAGDNWYQNVLNLTMAESEDVDHSDSTWRQQVERCEITTCALWKYRPKSRSKMPDMADTAPVQLHYEPISDEVRQGVMV